MQKDTEEILKPLFRGFAYVKRKNIRTFAERFARLSGFTDIPRNPDKILPVLGIRVLMPETPEDLGGYWSKSNGGYKIYVSVRDEESRRWFTIYHEVFEIMASMPSFPTGTYTKSEVERMADLFAAAVLMPEGAVREMAEEYRHQEYDKADVMAAKFGVSVSAMRITLRELGLKVKQQGPGRDRRKFPGNILKEWADRGERDSKEFLKDEEE